MNLHIAKTPEEVKRLQKQQQALKQQQRSTPSQRGKRFQVATTAQTKEGPPSPPQPILRKAEEEDDDDTGMNALAEQLLDPEDIADAGREFQLGDLVEIVKVKTPILVLVLARQKNGTRYEGMLSTGLTVDFRPSDVLFHVPDFLQSSEFKSLFAKGLLKSGSGEPVDMQQLIHNTELQAELLPQVARRIISTFDRMSLSRQWAAILRLQHIYAEFHEKEQREAADLQEITRRIYASEEGGAKAAAAAASPTYTELYAVHRYLTRDPLHFIQEQCDAATYENGDDPKHVMMGQFRFRPAAELRRITEAIRMVNDREPQFSEFIRRAHRIIDLRRSGMLDNHNSAHYKQPYSDTDMSFLELVRAFIHAEVNNIPRNPFLYPTSEIIKPLRYYDDLDTDTASAFLVDMGVWPAWENVVTLSEAVPLVGHHQSAQLENMSRRNEKLAQRLLSTPMFNYTSATASAAAPAAAASTKTPGPEDFYTRDVVEELRHDFGDLPVYTIDDSGAKELDDGISIERTADGHCWLHVHVADPTAYIPPQHLIAREAERQGSTVYYPERHYPMLPDALSIQRFSLGVNRQTRAPQGVLTFSARLNARTGELEDYRVRAGIIRNVHVLQYDKVDRILDWSNIARMKNDVIRRRMQRVWHIDGNRVLTTSSLDEAAATAQHGEGAAMTPEMERDLVELQHWANVHTKHRVKHGMLMFSLPAASIHTEPFPLPITQQPLQLLRYQQPELARMAPPSLVLQMERAMHSPARLMVAELMVMAGRVCGAWSYERHLPVHYRTQNAPVGLPNHIRESLLEESNRNYGLVDFMLFQQARAYMVPASQQMAPGIHWTMGIHDLHQGYVKCTSPLRRYTDMLVHWQIKSQLLRDAYPQESHRHAFSLSQLAMLAHRMLVQERDIRKEQDRAKRFWMIEFIERMGRGPAQTNEAAFRPSMPLDWSTLGARHWPAIILKVSSTGATHSAFILDLGMPVRLVAERGKLQNNALKLGDKIFCRIFKTSRDKLLIWAVEADGSACEEGRDLDKLAVI
ncbi:hypothetical protein SYNPS1DRAFT_21711 [Syncephalis pseudoplumigaleata]|uniref:RNB domain-containing protein n=1 Tax=Syncephalis pseudoplumigaleata TaxID=1712513 RepID=A0A4P9Z3G8_9FUNG|nr:hypothetical protein SYNPS1DRAFT_21711 [Syncephalis pseudoplumigaleata]|eukprot:RKP26552.1 hypothetical protein SYNPS1DRAFT_21711 [Syncephalis pseudoplumigaleata]